MWGAARHDRDQKLLRVGAARVRYAWPLYLTLAVFLPVFLDAIFFGGLSLALRKAGMNADASRSLPLLLALSLVALAFFIRWRQMRRVRSLLRSHGYLICLRCHYPISSDEERGRCPECSEWYQTADVITAWQEWESLQSTPVHGA
jgi:uncharacterized paraquat-inducible protein A